MACKQQDTVMANDVMTAYIKLSKSSLYKLARDGKVPGTKIGRHWRSQKSAIDEWMRTGTKPPNPKAPGQNAQKNKKTRKAR